MFGCSIRYLYNSRYVIQFVKIPYFLKNNWRKNFAKKLFIIVIVLQETINLQSISFEVTEI